MKKTLSFFFALLMSCITTSAQIQNGYVRSQGTSYNRNGSPLKGAKVFVKGLNGAKVTAANGTFNFNLGGGKTQFSIKDVILRGHTLLTPLAPAYNVGKAAVEIVMQSREERRQNEARISKIIEERITKTYNAKTRELQKKIAALEKALSDKQQNTEKLKCQIRALKEQLEYLDDQYLKRNELIDKMVEEYVNLDYATMDNRKAELCSYIESGELEKADSLLNTIDINKEMNDIKTLNQDIEEKESMLAMLPKEKEIRKNKIETVCMYWRGKYDIAIQNMQYDSAAVFIRNLADVDTSNFNNVLQCAMFFHTQNSFKEAELYYLIDLNNIEQEEDSNEPALTALLYNCLGCLYASTQRLRDSEDMLKESLTISERLAAENPQAYEPNLAESYNYLALLYAGTQRLKECEDMHKASLAIRERLAKETPQACEPALAESYNDLALLYAGTQRLKEGEDMYKKSLAIRERLAKENPQAYEPALAESYKNIALLYAGTQRLKEGEEMIKKSLAIRERLAKETPQAYEPALAESYKNLALLYGNTQRLKEGEEMLKKSLAIRERLAKENPQAYEPALAETYNYLALLYAGTQRLKEGEEMHKASLAIFERLAKENPQAYEPALAESYKNIALLYAGTQRLKEGEEMIKKSLAIRERLAKENPQAYELALAESYNYLALLYGNTERLKEGEDMYKKSLAIRERLAKENPQAYEPALAESYNYLACLYGATERIKECIEMHRAAMAIYERLYKNTPEQYQSRLADGYLKFGISMINNNRHSDAITLFESSLNLSKNMVKDANVKSIYLSSLFYLVELYSNAKDYKTAYIYNKELLPLLKEDYEKNAEQVEVVYNGMTINRSFCANLLDKFKEGEQYSIEALKIDSTQHHAYTNLAASLLLQGRFEEAEKLYREYKTEFKDGFLDDFAEFERLGVIPEERKADVERIKAMLNE